MRGTSVKILSSKPDWEQQMLGMDGDIMQISNSFLYRHLHERCQW